MYVDKFENLNGMNKIFRKIFYRWISNCFFLKKILVLNVFVDEFYEVFEGLLN